MALVLGLLPAIRPAKIAAAEPADAKTERPKEVATTGTMHISVVDEAGKPLPGAKLYVNSLPNPNRDYFCDANGQTDIVIPKMLHDLRLWVSSDGHVPLHAQWWPERQADGHLIPEAFTFRMPKGTVIDGTVKDPQGKPVAGVKVEVKYQENGDFQAVLDRRPRISNWLAEDATAKITDAEGRWTLDNVPPGEDNNLSVKLTHPDYISDMSWGDMQHKQLVTNQAMRAQTATIVIERGTTITGTLTDPDGKPVAELVVWGDHPYSEHRPQQEVLSDENGHYRFPPLPTGPMTVTVMALGWMPELRVVDITPEIAPVDFQLKPGKRLRRVSSTPRASHCPTSRPAFNAGRVKNRFTTSSIRMSSNRPFQGRPRTACMSGPGRPTMP